MHPPLHFLDTGSGKPIFLLHAFPMSHSMWEGQIQRLQRRYRIIAPDAYGFGQTPLPLEPWDFQRYARNLLDLAGLLRLDTFAVVGLSMGGYTAFEMLREAPGRIAAMVLANTRPRADTKEERAARMDLASAVENEGVGALADRILPRLLKNAPAPGPVCQVNAAIQQTTPAVIRRALEALAGRNDSVRLLTYIKQPALVLSGTDDAIAGTDETREWAGQIHGGQLVEIPDAGHLSNIENPDAFNDALEGFLKEAL